MHVCQHRSSISVHSNEKKKTKQKNPQCVAALYNENYVGGRVIQVSPPITILLSLASNCKLNCTNKAGGKTVMRS